MARVRNLNHAAKANKKATKTATEKAVKQSVIPVMSTKQSRKQPVGTYVEQTDTTPVEESPELSVDDLVIQPANSHVKLATKLCLAAAVSGQFKFAVSAHRQQNPSSVTLSNIHTEARCFRLSPSSGQPRRQ